MSTLNTVPAIEQHTRSSLTLFSTFRQSLHVSALLEFFLAARRSQSNKVLAISLLALLLTIPASILILGNGFDLARQNLHDARRISVFLPTETLEVTANQLTQTLVNNKHVSSAVLVPAQLVTTSLPDIAPPLMLEVTPAPSLTNDAVVALGDQLKGLAGVEFVELDAAQLGSTGSAVNLLERTKQIISALAFAIAALLMLVINSSDIRKSQTTIKLMKQLGGTPADIRRPFFYRSLSLGIFVAAVGLTAASGLLWLLSNLVDMSTYGALLATSASLPQLILFFITVISAGFIATAWVFCTKFTLYNQ